MDLSIVSNDVVVEAQLNQEEEANPEGRPTFGQVSFILALHLQGYYDRGLTLNQQRKRAPPEPER